MINYIFREYPYGNSEMFAEYELKYIAENKEKIRIFTFYEQADELKRTVPENTDVINVCKYKSILTYVRVIALFFLPIRSWKSEIYQKKNQKRS